jgi:alpha-L-rhamnosidase
MKNSFPDSLKQSTVVMLLAGSLFAAFPDAPIHLKCYDKAHPIGTDSRPYFGWIMNDPDDSEIQSAYQILVSSSQEKCDRGVGDLWDSGQVQSGMQNYIDYAGLPLDAGTRYYWKVRIWDKSGNGSLFSEPGYFETGLFQSEDWSGAEWIMGGGNERDDYIYFRKRIKIPDKPVRRAIVYITAMHKYTCYLNGRLIGKGPAYHYPQYCYYNGYDVTPACRGQGELVFAVLTHWFGAGQGRPSGHRGFLMKGMIEFDDATCLVFGTDGSWKQKRAEAWIPGQKWRNGEGIGYIEKIDASKIIADWFLPGYQDSDWAPALEIGAPPVEPWTGSLQPDLTRIIEREIVPISVTDLGGGTFVIDLGKVFSGVPKIQFESDLAGSVVEIRGGYTLNNDGTVSDTTTQKTDMRYFFVPAEKSAVFQPLEYLGMRYIQVDHSPNSLDRNNVRFITRHYELDAGRSSFRCSDPTLNAVWDLMKHSLIIGCHEQFVDTPTREKGGFLGDSWSQAVPAMTVMGDRAMNLRVLLEFLDSQDQYWPDGRLNAVYPNGDGKRDIPDYTQSYLVWVWDYTMQTGNMRFLKDHYQKLKKIADYVDTYRDSETGLIHNLAGGSGAYQYGIIDWPPQMRYGYDVSVESRTVIDAYAAIDFRIIADIARMLGYGSDEAAYLSKATDMEQAINHLLIRDGLYIDGLNPDGSQSTHVSQHANMFPVAMGIVPPENRLSVLNLIKQRRMQVGMVTLRWLPEALGRSDQGPHLIDLYTNENWDGWARTLALGGTATWESWDALTSGQSMSHPWGAVGLLGIQQYILGVEPIKPQHQEIRIKPLDFGDRLTFAEGLLPTDRGDIRIRWDRSTRYYRLTFSLPDNMTAQVYIPQCGIEGSLVEADHIDVTGRIEDRYIKIENVGSGEHHFKRILEPVND